MKYINGQKISDDLYPYVVELAKAAYDEEGIILIVDGGLRTEDEQIYLREKNIIDKTLKARDPEEYMRVIMKGDNGLFHPRTAAPGTSNHELDPVTKKQIAVDFRTKINYIVKAGETPEIVAKNNDTTVKRLTELNDGLNTPLVFKTGQVITVGILQAYSWLVRRAHSFGWVRMVPSERWHWERRPGVNQFFKVPKSHPTWDGLIK